MSPSTTYKRIFIVKKCIETKSFITVLRRLGSTFNCKSLRKKSIQINVAKHHNLDLSLNKDMNKDKENCERSRSVVADERNCAKVSAWWIRLDLSAQSFNPLIASVALI